MKVYTCVVGNLFISLEKYAVKGEKQHFFFVHLFQMSDPFTDGDIFKLFCLKTLIII